MADTLSDVLKRILGASRQSRDISAISDSDDTQYLVDRINEARQMLQSLDPTYIEADGTLTLPASTRKVSALTGLDLYTIPEWSWKINDADGDIPLEFVSLEFIHQNFPRYETYEASEPHYVYYDAGQVGFYPLLSAGSSSLTIQYRYPATSARLTALTDTFNGYPDKWMLFIEKYVLAQYEIFKGLGQPEFTLGLANDFLEEIRAGILKTKRIGIKHYRQIP